MNPKKYLIFYDWRPGRNGHYIYYGKFETNSFLIMVLKFLFLKLKYDIVDIVEYRN